MMLDEQKTPEAEAAGGDEAQRQIAGLNRRNTALEKELAGRDKELASMKERYQNTEVLLARLEERAALLTAREEAIQRATKEGISPGLAVQLASVEPGQTEANIRALVNEIKRAADHQVNERLASSPRPTSGDSGRPLTLDRLNSMSAAERGRIPQSVLDRLITEASR